jgi:CBS domain-containing protein
MVFVAQGTSMKTAANLLKLKAHQSVHTITPEDSVFDAIKLMADKNIGALLVMEAEKVAGIITERDYARKVVLMSRSSKQTPVREMLENDPRLLWNFTGASQGDCPGSPGTPGPFLTIMPSETNKKKKFIGLYIYK